MTNLLCEIVAKFNTTLNLKTAIGATSATLDSATDDSGVTLPTGRYGLTIDGGTAAEEFITCTLTGTALTSIKTVTMQGAETSGMTKTHRKGATVKITDFVVIKKMLDVLDGTTDFNASVPLKYDGVATLSAGSNEFATVLYADGLAIAGSPDATTAQKGITTMSVAPASAATPIAVGDNDPRVPSQGENDALVGTSGTPSTSNKYVTNDDTAVAATANEVARRGATGNVTVITESPGTNSTEAASTAFVGAAIIAANVPVTYTNGTTTKNLADASATQNIAHGLGKIPKYIRLNVVFGPSNALPTTIATLVYNGTTSSVVGSSGTSTTRTDANSSGNLQITSTSSSTDYQTGVITFDATNIIITWTKQNNPTGTVPILWEAITQ